MSTPIWTPWRITPRDPIVLGTGGTPPFAFVTATPPDLPRPSTVAGFVRRSFIDAAADVLPALAEKLVQIKVRGPWLRCGTEILLPAPADVVVVPPVGAAGNREFRRGTIRPAIDSQRMLWPDEPSQRLRAVDLAPKVNGVKTLRAGESGWPKFWSLEEILDYSLDPTHVPAPGPPGDMMKIERRFHVAIQDETLTADPGFLFSSTGVRFRDGVTLGLEVDASTSGLSAPSSGSFEVLGGEGRSVFREEQAGAAFPKFPSGRYQAALSKLGSRRRVGLRLQLVTPACFEPRSETDDQTLAAWLPGWLSLSTLEGKPEPQLGSLKLEAVAMPSGHDQISGWNLQSHEPRRIRRLVRAGTVYFFSFEGQSTADTIIDLCRRFWDEPIANASTTPDSTYLAPAANDGYGQTIPGFWIVD